MGGRRSMHTASLKPRQSQDEQSVLQWPVLTLNRSFSANLTQH